MNALFLFVVMIAAVSVSAKSCNAILGDADVIFIPQTQKCNDGFKQEAKEIAELNAKVQKLLQSMSSIGTCSDDHSFSFNPATTAASSTSASSASAGTGSQQTGSQQTQSSGASTGSPASSSSSSSSAPGTPVELEARARSSIIENPPSKGADVLAAAVRAAAVEGIIVTVDELPRQDENSFPLDKDLDYYLAACRSDPTKEIACSGRSRLRKLVDLAAMVEAKRLGLTLTPPPPQPASSGNSYKINRDDVSTEETVIVKQLKVLKKRAADEAAEKKKIADQQAAADAAAKAAAEKVKADAAAKEAEAKAAADAAAKAAADAAAAAAAAAGKTAAEQAAAAEAARQAADAKAAEEAAAREAAAQAAAAKAAADAKAAAEAKAAADAAAAAAAAPKLAMAATTAGQAIVDPNGMTLYTNEADPLNIRACEGPCLPNWPIARPGSVAGAGVTCTIGKVRRVDTGEDQLTCNGKPLYFSIKDKKPGDAKGHKDGFGFIIATNN